MIKHSGTLFILILSLLFLAACSEDSGDNNPVDNGNGNGLGTASFTIDGGGYNSESIELQNGLGYYDPEGDFTFLQFRGEEGPDSLLLGIAFPGDSSAQYQWQFETGVNLTIYNESESITFSGDDQSGLVEITEFGEIGGNITGSFSGRIYSIDDSLDVAGSFTAHRTGI